MDVDYSQTGTWCVTIPVILLSGIENGNPGGIQSDFHHWSIMLVVCGRHRRP